MILVVGATGELGGRVVRLLRQRAEPVRCLVRPETDDSSLRAVGADCVRGDLVDGGSLRSACEGVDVVVATATAIARQLSGRRSPSMREVDEIGMRLLVDAAESAGVARFVYVSYAGVDAGLGFPLERAKLATEQRLRASEMTVTVVRPDAFQEIHLAPLGRFDVVNGKVSVFGKGDTKHRWVSTDDVAALVASVAVDPHPPTLIEFGGPEALSRNEVIALAEQVTGRRMKRQRMPRPVARLGMRLLDKRSPALASVFGTGLLQDLVEATWDDALLRARGIAPKSTTDYIREQVRLSDDA